MVAPSSTCGLSSAGPRGRRHRRRIPNDIAGQPITDGTSAATVKALAEEAGVTILTINALQKFIAGPRARSRSDPHCAIRHDCGAKALILVPVNDGTGLGEASGTRISGSR